MSASDPLVQFIRLRLYDDQLAAEQATGDWPDGDEVAGEVKSIRVGAHVVRHDPARVLRGVQAKRRIVEDRDSSPFILRLLASEWSDHADYRAEWTP